MDNFESNTSRRFSSLARLYGEAANQVLAQSHVMLAGIGGVGSWAVEALARSGVGQLTLADLDHVAESNINRQVHALDSTVGMAKVEAMRERIAQINPDCQVNLIDDFIDAENIAPLLAQYQPDLLLDCTDQVQAKVAMLLAAREVKIGFYMCGGAGGKTDVLSLKQTDIAHARNDNLLGRIRTILRKQYGFAKGSDAHGKALKKVAPMKVRCFWFDQPAQLPSLWQNQAAAHEQVAQQAQLAPSPEAEAEGHAPETSQLNTAPQAQAQAVSPVQAPQGLSCAGYGSSVMVTASMGLALANSAIHELIQNRARM
ncbi:MAG: tRNA threonylcarbamoyladenosine dehydratase [Pelistega sp.]|nr:tRNA threonylcarbamoyladenosine dehydratase [Pelistega sp.]